MFQQEINQYLTTHHYTRIDLKAVLFDMDGVLFDSMKNHATAWHEAMKQYGMSLSKVSLPPRRTYRCGNHQHRQPKRKRL